MNAKGFSIQCEFKSRLNEGKPPAEHFFLSNYQQLEPDANSVGEFDQME